MPPDPFPAIACGDRWPERVNTEDGAGHRRVPYGPRGSEWRPARDPNCCKQKRRLQKNGKASMRMNWWFEIRTDVVRAQKEQTAGVSSDQVSFGFLDSLCTV